MSAQEGLSLVPLLICGCFCLVFFNIPLAGLCELGTECNLPFIKIIPSRQRRKREKKKVKSDDVTVPKG